MSFETRIQDIERKMAYVFETLDDLMAFRLKCYERLEALENGAGKEEGGLQKYIAGMRNIAQMVNVEFNKLTGEIMNKKEEKDSFKEDYEKMERRGMKLTDAANGVFERIVGKDDGRNIFKVRDKKVTSISEDSLLGLSLMMRKFDGLSLANCFDSCKVLSSIPFPSGFDTSSVLDMTDMFNSCKNLCSIDLSTFDTGRVTSMRGMFYKCHSLSSIDLSTFDTSNVKDMRSMFFECSALSSLDLSSFNTARVKDMSEMFAGCSSLISLDLLSFDTSKTVTMQWMFDGCTKLRKVEYNSSETKIKAALTEPHRER